MHLLTLGPGSELERRRQTQNSPHTGAAVLGIGPIRGEARPRLVVGLFAATALDHDTPSAGCHKEHKQPPKELDFMINCQPMGWRTHTSPLAVALAIVPPTQRVLHRAGGTDGRVDWATSLIVGIGWRAVPVAWLVRCKRVHPSQHGRCDKADADSEQRSQADSDGLLDFAARGRRRPVLPPAPSERAAPLLGCCRPFTSRPG